MERQTSVTIAQSLLVGDCIIIDGKVWIVVRSDFASVMVKREQQTKELLPWQVVQVIIEIKVFAS